ncbi:MAG: 6-phosphofructokinase [Bdellovibrionales bacterium]|nr:6-phosphofructokinase [Bdellovibrionales bacterium]
MLKKLAVLTSGGDAPGMNAAIRAVVRIAASRKVEVLGVKRGFRGLLHNEMVHLGVRDVGNIIQLGGTILRSSRCKEFFEREHRRRAAQVLNEREIGGLIIIGGDGSFRGAKEFSEDWNGRLVGIPGTIDNDIYGSDFTIGFHTAVDTALDAIDKVRDTADAHDRYFFIEVMGRHSGWIGLYAGIAGGAQETLIPEETQTVEEAYQRLLEGKKRGRKSSIMVMSEGCSGDGAVAIAKRFEEQTGNDCRAVVLGHIQRGGRPVASDRVLATQLGAYATELIIDGSSGIFVGNHKGALCHYPFEHSWEKKKPVDEYLLKLQEALAG